MRNSPLVNSHVVYLVAYGEVLDVKIETYEGFVPVHAPHMETLCPCGVAVDEVGERGEGEVSLYNILFHRRWGLGEREGVDVVDVKEAVNGIFLALVAAYLAELARGG